MATRPHICICRALGQDPNAAANVRGCSSRFAIFPARTQGGCGAGFKAVSNVLYRPHGLSTASYYQRCFKSSKLEDGHAISVQRVWICVRSQPLPPETVFTAASPKYHIAFIQNPVPRLATSLLFPPRCIKKKRILFQLLILSARGIQMSSTKTANYFQDISKKQTPPEINRDRPKSCGSRKADGWECRCMKF